MLFALRNDGCPLFSEVNFMTCKIFPWRAKNIDGQYVVTNEAGDFFFSSELAYKKFSSGKFSKNNEEFLDRTGFRYQNKYDFFETSHQFKIQKNRYIPKKIGYLLIVPTLRCDLNCSYCQVSRADQSAVGFDWSDETLQRFLNFVEVHGAPEVKIEFQGGEPTLRLDLMERIIDGVTNLRPNSSFVICTNLQNLSRRFLRIFENERVSISTSVDGPPKIHERNRTSDKSTTNQFFENLSTMIRHYGVSRISALPTFSNFDAIESTVDFYREVGLTEIFLRPVNFQGFARKKHKEISTSEGAWISAYKRGLAYIFKTNLNNERPIIETNFSLHLNRIIRNGENGHVDLRSPNPSGEDYLVVDFNGKFYPSDEARMLSRIGMIDLSMGNLKQGTDQKKLDMFNFSQDNSRDQVCNKCVYQAYCGVDVVDKISRYGRADYPTGNSYFCKTHTAIFDEVFKHIVSRSRMSYLNLSLHLTGKLEMNPVFGQSYYD